MKPEARARSSKGITIVIGAEAPVVERYAAEELQKYLRILFQIDSRVADDAAEPPAGRTILVGSPAGNRITGRRAGRLDWAGLSEDGFFLWTLGRDPEVLAVGGRSGRGTLFGVYQLVQRWGARFSLSQDILPAAPGPLRLSGFDIRMNPAYGVRCLFPLGNLPEGAAAWDLSDFRRFIDQMVKLAYNALGILVLESGPWLDYEFRGVRRPAGEACYGFGYPIDDGFIGRHLFEGRTELASPALAGARNGEERKQLGIGLVRSVISHCRQRGLLSVLHFPFLEPPTELKHRMNEWATLPLPDPKLFAGAHFTVTPAEEFGTNPRYAAWMNVRDPAVQELTSVRIRALIDTYPEADCYCLGVSEHRAGVIDYREIFAELDAKYHFSPGFNLEKELEQPGDFAYGRERYQAQMKGDVIFLWLFDKLFNENQLLLKTAKPDARIALSGIMPGLAALASRVLPHGASLEEFLDYGTHATADRIGALIPLLDAGVPTILQVGLQDDNTMWFPQINVESAEMIVRQTASRRMDGYSAVIWQARQADINAAFLGMASLQPGLTAEAFYADYLSALVGPDATPELRRAFSLIERADRAVKKELYGFAFAWVDALENKLNGVDQAAIDRIRPLWDEALARLLKAKALAGERGQGIIDFWIRSTQFAIRWVALGAAAAELGKLLESARSPGSFLTASIRRQALARLDKLLSETRDLIDLVVSDARHICDLGQIASLNRYVRRYLVGLRADIAARPTDEPDRPEAPELPEALDLPAEEKAFSILSINVSDQKGVQKRPIPKAVLKEDFGIEGDAHAGPWHRQVSLLADEDIETMRGRGIELGFGDFAENITTRGIDLGSLPVGARLHLGEVVLEITQIGKKCHHGCEIFKAIGDCVMPRRGVFARVIRGGEIYPGSRCHYRP